MRFTFRLSFLTAASLLRGGQSAAGGRLLVLGGADAAGIAAAARLLVLRGAHAGAATAGAGAGGAAGKRLSRPQCHHALQGGDYHWHPLLRDLERDDGEKQGTTSKSLKMPCLLTMEGHPMLRPILGAMHLPWVAPPQGTDRSTHW